MAPLIVLLTSFATLLLLHKLKWKALGSWVICLRWSLAAMFMLTSSAHWGTRRPDLVAMVPDLFPNPELLVTLTGLAEIAGSIGLLIPRFASAAAPGLALLLIAIFPANVHAARESLSIGGQPVMSLVPRALLQVIFLSAVLAAGFARPRPQRLGTERV